MFVFLVHLPEDKKLDGPCLCLALWENYFDFSVKSRMAWPGIEVQAHATHFDSLCASTLNSFYTVQWAHFRQRVPAKAIWEQNLPERHPHVPQDVLGSAQFFGDDKGQP